MINFGMLNTNTNPMGDMLRGSQITAELKKAQNQYNVQDALYQLSQKPNPTYQDYEGIMNNYPQLAEVVKAPMANIDEKRRRVAEQNFAPVMAAAQNGRLDYVGDLLKKQEEAYINSGDSENAQAVQTMRKMFELDPAVGKTTLGLMGMAVAPDTMKSIFAQSELDTQNLKNTAQAGQAFAETRKSEMATALMPKQVEADVAAKGAGAYAATARGDYDAAQMAQLPYKQAREDAEFFAKQDEKRQQLAKLPESTVKFINENTQQSDKARLQSEKAGNLAARLQSLSDSGANSISSMFGNAAAKLRYQTELQAAIEDSKRLRNMDAIQALPPGSSSNADVLFAMEGLPKNTDDPAVMARYMRGIEAANRWVSFYTQAQADWAAANGGALSPLRSPAVIHGREIPVGTAFNKAVLDLYKEEEQLKKERKPNN